MGHKPALYRGLTIAEHAARLGISRRCLRARRARGWTEEEMFTTPKRGHAFDDLDAEILVKRITPASPLLSQQGIADRFGVTRQSVSLRERALVAKRGSTT